MEDHLYKSCQGDYIVVLKKLDDTKTNESRKDIVDPMYAKFRANKLMVVRIYNKHTGEEVNSIKNSVYHTKKITYTCNEVVEVTNYDGNVDEICSTGIHYFKCEEAAKFYEHVMSENATLKEVKQSYTGPYKQWSSNGQIL